MNNGTLEGGDGTGTAQFTLHPVRLALVKQARDLTGVVLPDGANVEAGEDIYFVLFVENPTPYASADVQIVDELAASDFTYVPGSIETAVVPSGSTDAELWAGPWIPQTDSAGTEDIASISDAQAPPGLDRITIGAVEGQSNLVVPVEGQSKLAIRFRVTVN